MAARLPAGELTVHLQYGKDLKDCDWFGKQDPYVTLKCGNTKYRSNTHLEGGTSPVWDQKFVFKVDQEPVIDVEVRDEDTIKDDFIGRGQIGIAAVRRLGSEQQQVPLFRRVSKRQQGHLVVTLTFLPASSSAAGPTPAAAAPIPPGSPHDPAWAAAGGARASDVPGFSSSGHGGVGPHVGPHASPRPSHSGQAAGHAAGADGVAAYEPTTGLIEPRPHQMLPCHQGSRTGAASLGAGGAAPPQEAGLYPHPPHHPQHQHQHQPAYGMDAAPPPGPGYHAASAHHAQPYPPPAPPAPYASGAAPSFHDPAAATAPVWQYASAPPPAGYGPPPGHGGPHPAAAPQHPQHPQHPHHQASVGHSYGGQHLGGGHPAGQSAPYAPYPADPYTAAPYPPVGGGYGGLAYGAPPPAPSYGAPGYGGPGYPHAAAAPHPGSYPGQMPYA